MAIRSGGAIAPRPTPGQPASAVRSSVRSARVPVVVRRGRTPVGAPSRWRGAAPAARPSPGTPACPDCPVSGRTGVHACACRRARLLRVDGGQRGGPGARTLPCRRAVLGDRLVVRRAFVVPREMTSPAAGAPGRWGSEPPDRRSPDRRPSSSGSEPSVAHGGLPPRPTLDAGPLRHRTRSRPRPREPSPGHANGRAPVGCPAVHRRISSSATPSTPRPRRSGGAAPPRGCGCRPP